MVAAHLRSKLVIGLFFIAVTTSNLSAQGLLMVHSETQSIRLPRPNPRPPGRTIRPQPVGSYQIRDLTVDARLLDQIAQVQLSQTFVNTSRRQMEVSFVFPIPHDAAIDKLTLLVDGKEYAGKLLPAKEARRIYEGYIRKNRDPALLEWLGAGMFKTSIFPVPPGADRTVTLRYSQLLSKDGTLTDFLFPLSTAKYTSTPIETVNVRVAIESSRKLTSIYSPTHSVTVDQMGGKHAVVKYSQTNEIPSTDFRLFFDVSREKIGASVISYRPQRDEDGYFLLLASPRANLPRGDQVAKNVICVFDRSGSMQGEKIEQARQAMRFIVDRLDSQDRFNIVAYDSEIESFHKELQPATKANRKKAIGFIQGLYAGGSTNIEGALRTALTMVGDSSKANYIVFLTDGLPTTGETNESKIVQSAKEKNASQTRLINFGVGYDVNSRLLDRLARENRGQSHYVRPDEDIEAHVSRLYTKISSPLLTDVDVRFEFDSIRTEDGKPINRVYPREVIDLFHGEQLVLVGRYRQSGRVKVLIEGSVGGEKHTLDFPSRLKKHTSDEKYGFIERLWAMRRIGEIIDELDLKGRNEELVSELIALSTKHGILTPYTSYLADDQADETELASAARGGRLSVAQTDQALRRLNETRGRAAFSQRAIKLQLRSAQNAAPSSSQGLGRKPGERLPASGKVAGGIAGNVVYDLEADEAVVIDTVRHIGNRALYRRGEHRWITADAAKLDSLREDDNYRTVQRFSDEYFLIVSEASTFNKGVLASQKNSEEILIEFKGELIVIK